MARRDTRGIIKALGANGGKVVVRGYCTTGSGRENDARPLKNSGYYIIKVMHHAFLDFHEFKEGSSLFWI